MNNSNNILNQNLDSQINRKNLKRKKIYLNHKYAYYHLPNHRSINF
jgi:hypothetical protein